MQACDHIHALSRSGGQGGVFSVGAISQEDVALFELVPESVQQAQVMVMEAAQDDVEDGPAGQGEERDKPQDGKAAAGLLRRGLGVTSLVLAGVGQLGGRGVDHLNRTPVELAAWAGPTIRGLGGGGEGLFQSFFGPAEPALDIDGVALIDVAAALQPEEGLNLAHDFPTGGFGVEQLPEEALEGQVQTKDAVAAVGALVFGREQGRWEEVAQVFLELGQSGLANQVSGPAAQGGQPGTEGGEIGCVDRKSVA